MRFKIAKGKANRTSWVVALVGLFIFIGCGAFIYYNTDVLHKFRTNFQQEELQASYEKKFENSGMFHSQRSLM